MKPRKISLCLLALAMTMAMSTSAFAAGPDEPEGLYTRGKNAWTKPRRGLAGRRNAFEGRICLFFGVALSGRTILGLGATKKAHFSIG